MTELSRVLRRKAAAVILSLFVSVFSACSDDESPTEGTPPPSPFITSLSDTALAPDDTLFVAGGNFSTNPAAVRVVFANTLAQAAPFYASSESLAVVVPPSANSGPLTVVSLGVSSAPRLVTIERGIGDVWVVGGGISYDFKLEADALARYLVVPFSAATVPNAVFSYNVTPEDAAVFPTPPRSPDVDGGTRNAAVDFERRRWEYAEAHLRDHRGPLRHEADIPAAAPAEERTFRVLRCNPCDPGQETHVTITATRVYTGTTALVYADLNQPTGGFTQADYDAFGTAFDNSIFPTDTTFFGPVTDIDGNGKVVLLFTPVVNGLTPPGSQGFITGFFAPLDLAPSVAPPGTSNAMEVFYVVVADPQGERGPVLTRQQLQNVIPATLAHELEHMISFGYRITNIGVSGVQVTWFEEGMAHMAEDVNNIDADNIARMNLYLGELQRTSLLGDDTLEQRGGIFLFIRYLADRYGEGILKEMVQSACKGIFCVFESTGRDFFELVAEFHATLYLSGRNITTDPAYNYQSLNTPFNALVVRGPRSVADGPIIGGVFGIAGDHYVIDGFSTPAARLEVTGAPDGRIRVVAVRIQ